MDGFYNGKPYFLMDDLGVPPFKETPMAHIYVKFRGGKLGMLLLPGVHFWGVLHFL